MAGLHTTTAVNDAVPPRLQPPSRGESLRASHSRADTDPACVPRMALPPRAHGARIGVRERACVNRWCVTPWPL